MFTETGRLRGVGRILEAAATPHGIDRYVELVAPTWSTSEVRGRVVDVRRQTANTVTLTIEANRHWGGFRAGQHTLLTVEIDGVRHTRSYSMANAAGLGDRVFELTVKAQPGGVVSTFLVERAAVGMVVWLSLAQGDFVLPPNVDGPLLLVSGGSGITPVMSMLRTLCAARHGGRVTFAHYALRRDDMTYAAELERLAGEHPNVRLVRIFTEEPGAGDLDGFADEAQLDAIDPGWRAAEAFLCGPAPMMSAFESIYEASGMSAQLHTERFTLAHLIAESGNVGGRIHFASSATTVDSDGTTVLTQAELAGLSPASGCRMGICRTCVCPLLAGTVRDVMTGELTTGAGEEVRVCVSVPVGDVEIDL